MKRFLTLGFVATLILVGACWSTTRNPLFCDGAVNACNDPALPFCDLTLKQCVSTAPDGFVGDQGAPPDLTPMCQGNASCTTATAPICDATSKTCRACMSGDCDGTSAKPVCAPSGACVECVSKSDCAAAGKACDTGSNTCVACKANSECESGACRADGVCAQASDIAYLDNKGAICDMTTHAGTMADPYCLTSDALASAKSTILVAGSAAAYDTITVTGAVDKNIIGPGREAMPPARFFKDSGNALAMTIASGTSTLSIAGIVLNGGVGTPSAAVSCLGAGGTTVSLTIVRSTIRNSGGIAVQSTGCAMTLDSNEVTQNQGGGIKLAGGTYSISNNIIALNGNIGTATVPGVSIDATSSGTFSFNTVAKNQVSAGVGGIDCSAVAHTIAQSAVVQNTAVSSTQFTGSCTFTDVVAGSTETASGVTKLDPAFVSSSNFRLDMTSGAPKTANEACCVDKVATATNTHDVDFQPRPRHGQWDIGAFEAP